MPEYVLAGLWPLGCRIVCPKCGKVGKASIHKVTWRGRVYNYLAVIHGSKWCTIARIEPVRGWTGEVRYEPYIFHSPALLEKLLRQIYGSEVRKLTLTQEEGDALERPPSGEGGAGALRVEPGSGLVLIPLPEREGGAEGEEGAKPEGVEPSVEVKPRKRGARRVRSGG
jgi:hypothetical protein